MSTLLSNLANTEALSFGSSKLFQIVTPLSAYFILQETPLLEKVFPKVVRFFRAEADVGRWEYIFKMLVGFMTWKIGCDFGFLIVDISAVHWSIAFTLAGLIPYAIGMYVVYYLFGRKILIQGQLNPFKEEYIPPKISGRPSLWRQFISKFLHEDMNSTSANVPMRQVSVKPIIDYGSILITWPLYNSALFFFQTGELNFDPFVHFTFLKILVFYIVNVFGFAIGFNLGEFLYFQIHRSIEFLKARSRQVSLLVRTKEIWDAFDLDSDGAITPAELRAAIKSLGQDPTKAELRALLRKIDFQGSGTIEFDEFRAFLEANQTDRRMRLLLKNFTETKPNAIARLLSAIAVRLKALQNDTTYIRLQGLLQRYGLNNRWLLSGSMGLLFIVLLEPPIASALFGLSDTIGHVWFYKLGSVEGPHLQQVLAVSREIELPATETTIEYLWEQWSQIQLP